MEFKVGVQFLGIVIFLFLLSPSVIRTHDHGRHRGTMDYDFDYEYLSQKSTAFRQNVNPMTGNGRGCPRQFAGRCVCEYRIDNKYDPTPKPKYFVDCASSGFTNTSMLEYLPVETEVLIFTGNKLPYLRGNIFGKQNHSPKLRVIDMTNNGIVEIDGKAFHHVESVEVLLLAHNELSNSSLHKHPRIFSNFYSLKDLYLTNTFNDEIWSFSDLGKIFGESNLTKLEKLHLGMNELTIITDPSAFCRLPSLRHLYIPQNQLTEDVEVNVTCLPNLEVIDLRQNKIRTVTPKSNLWKLLNATNEKGEEIRVELLENPFHCDCNLQAFITWLKATILNNPDSIRDDENLVCKTASPTNNTHLYLRQVEVTTCDILTASSTASTVATNVVWILSVICVLVLFTCLYVYRMYILKKVSPLIQAAATGVKYTSIDKNETVEIAHV